MDSLTAYYLAGELDRRWRGRRVRASHLGREARQVDIEVEGTPAVRFDLARPDAIVHDGPRPDRSGPMGGWTVAGVRAPEDDRRLVVDLARPGRFRGSPDRRATLEVSFVPAARGAVLRDAGGARMASVGARLPAPTPPRPVADQEAIARAWAARDADALLAFRWMSATVSRWILSAPSADEAIERHRRIGSLPEPHPSRCDEEIVALPLCEGAVPVPSLVAPAPLDERAASGEPPADRRERALRRMREQLARARAAPRTRQIADALMMLGDVRTPDRVMLPDGAAAPVPPHRGERAVETAERLYADVRSMERALKRLPARIAELERAAGERDAAARPARERPARPGSSRPFRTYRSSGGLAIWVGRGAASNDALTFRESARDDVWLHARDAAGAHVVLRWSREEPPPARDLEEAAMLAAWHSRSRGSAVVPVDWTRRKYVRKPRGAPPGLVTLQRAATLLVRPDAEVERRLRDDGRR